MVEPTNQEKLYEQQLAAAEAANAPKVVYNTKKRYVVKPHQYQSGGWIKSPGMLELFRASDAALAEIAHKRGHQVTQVKKIRAAICEGESKIYIVPTDDEDEDGLDLKRTRGKINVNLVSFLAPNKLCIEAGYKERFEMTEAGADSPVGPALVFDIRKPAERDLLPPSQRRGGNRRRPQAPASDSTSDV